MKRSDKVRQELKGLLAEKGIIATEIWFDYGFSWYSAWWATDEEGNDYWLGKKIDEAKDNIRNGKYIQEQN